MSNEATPKITKKEAVTALTDGLIHVGPRGKTVLIVIGVIVAQLAALDSGLTYVRARPQLSAGRSSTRTSTLSSSWPPSARSLRSSSNGKCMITITNIDPIVMISYQCINCTHVYSRRYDDTTGCPRCDREKS